MIYFQSKLAGVCDATMIKETLAAFDCRRHKTRTHDRRSLSKN